MSYFRFSKFKKFFSRSVFCELQIRQILNFKTSCCNLTSKVWEKKRVRFFSIYVSFLWYFILNIIAPRLLCEKALLNKTHDGKIISKFPRTVLQPFMINARMCLPQIDKVLINESGVCQSSNSQSFWQTFFGRKVN